MIRDVNGKRQDNERSAVMTIDNKKCKKMQEGSKWQKLKICRRDKMFFSTKDTFDERVTSWPIPR